MKRPKFKKSDLSHFPVDMIKPAVDNHLLYDRFGIANPDDRGLAASIMERGILEPLVISSDQVLLSGHRRLAAAKYLGLTQVPVRMIDTEYESLTKPQKLELLRVHNQQRDKTPSERVKEKMLEIDPEKARLELVNQWVKATAKVKSNVSLGRVKTRSRITTLQFLAAVQRVIEENRQYLPLTDRRVHYLLLNNPPLRHDKKPNSTYANDKSSYKALTNLLIRARLNNDIPMDCIEDSTRPIQLGGGFSSVEQFIAQETENYLLGYSRNLMQGQPKHIEIMLEKNALRTVLEPVAREFNIPMTTGRGFSSLSPRYEVYRRFRQSGKDRLVLLMLTDFDPDGDQIAASFARSLRDDFRIHNIDAVKVALTAEDVEQYDLPSDMDAKPSSPNYRKFINRYRATKVVELDAAPVQLLQQKLRDAITGVIDVEEFNRQIDQQNQDAAYIEAHRLVVFEAIKGA